MCICDSGFWFFLCGTMGGEILKMMENTGAQIRGSFCAMLAVVGFGGWEIWLVIFAHDARTFCSLLSFASPKESNKEKATPFKKLRRKGGELDAELCVNSYLALPQVVRAMIGRGNSTLGSMISTHCEKWRMGRGGKYGMDIVISGINETFMKAVLILVAVLFAANADAQLLAFAGRAKVAAPYTVADLMAPNHELRKTRGLICAGSVCLGVGGGAVLAGAVYSLGAYGQNATTGQDVTDQSIINRAHAIEGGGIVLATGGLIMLVCGVHERRAYHHSRMSMIAPKNNEMGLGYNF